MDCSMIRLDGVTKHFGDVAAVDSASLCVARGEIVALLGPSGCGKTTLLRLIAGFERPDGGSVTVDGRLVASRAAWIAPEARRVGMVFQDYALFPHLTVAGNVGFGLPRRTARAACPSSSRSSVSTGSSAAIRTSSPADSSSASRSRARSLPHPSSCCWTSRGRTSTRSCASHCAPRSRRSFARSGSRCSS